MNREIQHVAGYRIRAERLARGWTQPELAERSGTYKNMVQRAEYGQCSTIGIFQALAQGLGMTIGQLLADDWKEPAVEPVLTPFLTDVLQSVSGGLSMEEVAREQDVTPRVIAWALQAVYQTLRVQDYAPELRLAEAVHVAREKGLIP